jgi:hypothetical protein
VISEASDDPQAALTSFLARLKERVDQLPDP